MFIYLSFLGGATGRQPIEAVGGAGDRPVQPGLAQRQQQQVNQGSCQLVAGGRGPKQRQSGPKRRLNANIKR